MRYASSRLFPLYAELEEVHGRYQSFQIDAIKGIETVKALGAEHSFRELMLRQFHGVVRKRFQADFMMMSYNGTIYSITLLSVMLFLLVGAHQVMQGKMSIGALVAFNALVALANAPIVALMTLWDNLQHATVYLNRLDDIFQTEPEQGTDRSRLIPVKSLEGRISFRRMGFRYGGVESPPILEDITVEIPPNTMVAIVGRSGSGKTTLIKCLAGLLEPTDGAILYDGIDLKSLNYRDLRRKIGFVLQENHLFDDTIARNIAFGEEEPDLDAVMWAAQVANAREFIEQLPLRLRHADRRVGARPVRRAAAAHRDRARHLQPAAGARLRRGHQRPRHRVRARREGEHRPAARGPYLLRHCPPPEHGARRRPDPRAGEGPPRRGGPARGPDEAAGPVLLPRQPAAGTLG